MTDQTTDLRCPECEKPISAAELASVGICSTCERQAVESMPELGGSEKAADVSGDGEPVDPVAPAPADAAAAGDPSPDDVLQEVLAAAAQIVGFATWIRDNLYLVEGDEVCRVIGNWSDAIIAGGEEILDTLVPGWRAAMEAE